MDAATAGRMLAERHTPAAFDGVHSLLNYPESPRVGDWSFRAALMRMAQPEPQQVAEVLDLSRRLDAVLHQVSKALAKHAVTCDRQLDLSHTDPIEPYGDARAVDLARLRNDSGDAAIDSYDNVADLTQEERTAIPLLAVALRFDHLANALASWANDRTGPPPVALAAETCEVVRADLDSLGVPAEQAPAGFRGRG